MLKRNRRKNKKEKLAKESVVAKHEAEAEAGADRLGKDKVQENSLPR